MSRFVYRIAPAEHAGNAETLLNGVGAARFGQRWNSAGTAVAYCAENPAVCMVEMIVHLLAHPDEDKRKRVVAAVVIPDQVDHWDLELELPLARVDQCDPMWRKGGNNTCRTIGNNWIASRNSLMLSVPSAVMPQSRNVLINPNHPQFPLVLDANRDLNTAPFQWDSRIGEVIDRFGRGGSVIVPLMATDQE